MIKLKVEEAIIPCVDKVMQIDLQTCSSNKAVMASLLFITSETR